MNKKKNEIFEKYFIDIETSRLNDKIEKYRFLPSSPAGESIDEKSVKMYFSTDVAFYRPLPDLHQCYPSNQASNQDTIRAYAQIDLLHSMNILYELLDTEEAKEKRIAKRIEKLSLEENEQYLIEIDNYAGTTYATPKEEGSLDFSLRKSSLAYLSNKYEYGRNQIRYKYENERNAPNQIPGIY